MMQLWHLPAGSNRAVLTSQCNDVDKIICIFAYKCFIFYLFILFYVFIYLFYFVQYTTYFLNFIMSNKNISASGSFIMPHI